MFFSVGGDFVGGGGGGEFQCPPVLPTFFTKILSTWFKNPKIVYKCIVLNGAVVKKNPNMPNLHTIISKSEDQKSWDLGLNPTLWQHWCPPPPPPCIKCCQLFYFSRALCSTSVISHSKKICYIASFLLASISAVVLLLPHQQSSPLSPSCHFVAHTALCTISFPALHQVLL